MIKKEITKNKSFQMNLALIAIGVLLVLGCPASSNSNGGDTTAPSLVSSSSMPAADATDFAANSNIILTYSEAVQAGTGNITIVPSSGGTTLTIAVGDAQVSIAGAVVTINPTNDLAMSTTYTLTIPAGAFMDAAGNKTAELTLSFSTAAALDTTAPTLSSSFPVSGAMDFRFDANILLTFSESVQVGATPAPDPITLTPSDGGQVVEIAVSAAQVSISTDGTVVTIDPTDDLMRNISYVLVIPAGAFVDAAGNKTAELTLSFSTFPDTTAPTVISSMPATDVLINVADNIVLTYSEPVLKGSGNIRLVSIESGGREVMIDVTDDTQVSVVNNVVTIDPTVDLGVDSGNDFQFTYELTIDADAFMDASDNKTAGYVLQFKILGNIAPMISSSIPLSGARDFSADSDITLTYSEAAVKGSGIITLTPSGGGEALMIDVTDAQVSLSADGTVVTINPSTNLVLGTSYELALPRGIFMDANRNPSPAATLSFSTSATLDTTAPIFVSSLPARDATNFSANSNIVLTYGELIFKGSGDITITPVGGGTPLTIVVTDAQVDISADGTVVTINPSTNLELNTQYTLAIPAGAFRDVNGNTSPAETVSFRTAATLDTTGPLFVSSLPANGATGYSADGIIVLTFNERVQAGTGNIQVRARKDSVTIVHDIPASDPQITIMGNMVIIDLTDDVVLDASTGNLVLDTSYMLLLQDASILDTSGNKTADRTVSFSTAATLDTTAPTLSSSVPASGATAVIADSDIVLTYNEAVVKGSGNITLAPMGGGTPLTIPVSSPSVSISADNTVVTIDPTDVLELNTQYTLTIPAGAFTDASGNSEPELTRSFTTEASLTPRIVSHVPAEAGTIASDAGITLTYNQPMVKGSGMITLKTSNERMDTIDVSGSLVSTSGNVVTIDISGFSSGRDSSDGSSYEVALTVPVAAFANADGKNPLSELILTFTVSRPAGE